jgi:hypothetical protein
MLGYPNISLGPVFGLNKAIFSHVLPPIFSPFDLPIRPVISPNPAILSPVLSLIRSPFDLQIRPICRPKQSDLTRDQRRDCQLLSRIKQSYSEIQRNTRYTIRQIQKACTTTVTSRKRSGRPPVLTQAQIEKLVEFVCASQKNC